MKSDSLSWPQVAVALLVGLAFRLWFLWQFGCEAGDTRVYEQLAQNWLSHGVYGLWVEGRLVPVDVRMPGYPMFLAGIYTLTRLSAEAARMYVMLAQVLVDLGTCLLIALLAARLSPPRARIRATTAALWLAALCPFFANYVATLLTEVFAIFFTAAALLCFVRAYEGNETLDARLGKIPVAVNLWVLGAFLVGMGTLFRPETPLLLIAVGLLLAWRWRRLADWRRLVRTGLLMALGLLLPLLPWAARNLVTLHRVQFLAPRYANVPEEYVPRGFLAWTQTWLVRFRDVYRVPWRLEESTIRIEDVPDSAFDSPEERARVAELLARYNQDLTMPPELDAEFAQLARDRAQRHPLRTYVAIPLRRVATMWLTPRAELLPYSGNPWPPGEKWEDDPPDFLVSSGLGLLNIVYLGLALVGAWRVRQNPAAAVLLVFILVRTAYFTRVETPEPRYVLECFPAVLAFAAQCWSRFHRRGAEAEARDSRHHTG